MTSKAPLPAFASFARELASAARRETVGRLNPCVDVENKGDEALFDPVTEADRAAEHAMRSLIAERFSDHGISGEEFPDFTLDQLVQFRLR